MGTLLCIEDETSRPYWQTPHLSIKDDVISVGVITSDTLDRVWYCRDCEQWHCGEELLIIGNTLAICSCGGLAEKCPF